MRIIGLRLVRLVIIVSYFPMVSGSATNLSIEDAFVSNSSN